MRILAYLLSLLMIIAPTYSAYAVNITKGQIISMGKQGGALVVTGGGKLVKLASVGGLGTAIYAFQTCMQNKKCRDKIDDLVEFVCSDDRCSINREGDEYCASGVYSYGSYKRGSKEYVVGQVMKSIGTEKSEVKFDFSTKGIARFTITKSAYGRDYSDTMVCVTNPSDDDKKLSDDELKSLAKKIAENMDDEDIVNYYNTEYGDITINNNHYYGDTLNKETNIDNKCQNDSCDEVSSEIADDIKKGKYDIDDVNEQNCTKDQKTRKYIQCSFDFGDDSTDDSNKDKDKDKDKDDSKKDDKDEKTDNKAEKTDESYKCKTSDLTKEACEFFDWVDDEPDKKEDKKIEVEDEEEEPLSKDKIHVEGVCPPDEKIHITMPWGYSTTITFTYKPYCDFARSIKPYMTATGAIVSMYIVGSCGRRL